VVGQENRGKRSYVWKCSEYGTSELCIKGLIQTY
jgi:hypothetical protein